MLLFKNRFFLVLQSLLLALFTTWLGPIASVSYGQCAGPYQGFQAASNIGNQSYNGRLGLGFTVNSPIRVTQLGAFDSGGDGISGSISVGIVDTSGVLVGNSVSVVGTGSTFQGFRMEDVTPFVLSPGEYILVAFGFSTNDLNGNSNIGGFPTVGLDEGGGLITHLSTYYDNTQSFGIPSNTFDVGGFHAATFIFNEATAPAIECHDITVYLDSTGNYLMQNNEALISLTDNCGSFYGPFTMGGPNARMFDCSFVDSTFQRTMVSTDPSGNRGSCTYNVTVWDTVSPVLVCQDITIFLDNSGNATLTGNDIDNGSFDACGNLSLSVSPSTFICDDVGANTVVLTGTDNNGNTSTCSSIVTVRDTVSPVLICQESIVIELDGDGQATLLPSAVANGSSDACGPLSFRLNQSTFDCDDVPSSGVILTVTDNNNNTATCTANITILDRIAPVIECEDITVYLDSTGNYLMQNNEALISLTDNCGRFNGPFTMGGPNARMFDCSFVDSTFLRTMVSTDSSGNRGSCAYSVTVLDTIVPSASCIDTSIFLDSLGQAEITIEEVNNESYDNCAIVNLDRTNFTCADLGVNEVTLTITDMSGNTANCTAFVNVVDTISPNILCPSDITVECLDFNNIDSLAIYGWATASDNCLQDLVIVESILNEINICNVGLLSRIFSTTDQSGNTSQCTQTISVINTMPFDGNDPASLKWPVDFDTVSMCGFNDFLPVTLPDSIAEPVIKDDICNLVGVNFQDSVVINDMDEYCYIINRVWTVTSWCQIDSSGDPETWKHTQIIGVNDNSSPELNFPDSTIVYVINECILDSLNIEAEVMDSCASQEDLIWTYALLMDSDTVISGSGKNISGPLFPGEYIVSFQVEDMCGNSSEGSYFIEIFSEITPVAVCIESVVISLPSSGEVTITPDNIDQGSYSSCGGLLSFSVTPSTFDCNDLGPTNPVVLTVTNEFGNTNSCMANVSVQDNIPPGLSCPTAPVEVFCYQNIPDSLISANDNCLGTTISLLREITTENACNEQWPDNILRRIVRNYQATDASGNQSTTCDVIFDITKINEDDIVWPENLTISNNNPLSCSGDFPVIPQGDPFEGHPSPLDINGFVGTGVPFINGVPLYPSLDISECNILTSFDDSFIMINCIQRIMRRWQIFNFSCENLPPYEFIQIIEIADTLSPVLVSPPDDITTQCGKGVLIPPVLFSDACNSIGKVNVTIMSMDGQYSIFIEGFDYENGQSFDLDTGEYVVEYIAYDDCGNEASHSINVNVLEDTTPPGCYTRDITVYLDEQGMVNISPEDIEGECLNAPVLICHEFAALSLVPVDTDGDGLEDFVGATLSAIDLITEAYSRCHSALTLSFSQNPADNQKEFDCNDLGINSVEIWATDVLGNTSFCMVNVDVQDNSDLCAGNKNNTNNNITNHQNRPPQVSGRGFYDNCIIDTIILSTTTFFCNDIGINNVIVTVTDEAGNSSSCESRVTVLDTVPPVLQCRDITIDLDGDGIAIITTEMLNDGSYDNCQIASLFLSRTEFTCSDLGQNSVILTASDNSGNTGECTAFVTVQDVTDPECHTKNITIYLDEQGEALITPDDVEAECEKLPVIYCLNSLIVSLNDNTNAQMSASHFIADSASPCQSPLTFSFSPDISDSLIVWDCNDLGTQIVEIWVTDDYGNQDFCVTSVAVQDNLDFCQGMNPNQDVPVVRCSNAFLTIGENLIAELNANDLDAGSYSTLNTSLTFSFSPDITDNIKTFDCADLGTQSVQLWVIDEQGNSNFCRTTVEVLDNFNFCDGSLNNPEKNNTINQNRPSYISGSGFSDNCTIDTIILSQSRFTCDDIGDNNITVSVIDESANLSTCQAIVTVLDTLAPTVVCPDVTLQLNPGECETLYDFMDPLISDNCGIDTIFYSPSREHLFSIGQTTVNILVIDLSGNSSECNFEVIVQEFLPNSNALACNDNVRLSIGAECIAQVTPDMILEGDIYRCYQNYCLEITDERGNVIGSSADSSNFVTREHIGRTLGVTICTDCNNPMANCCWSTILIEDKLLPVLNCMNLEISCLEEDRIYLPIYNGDFLGLPEVDENCGTVSLSYTDMTSGNSCNKTILRSWSATDASGNKSELCSQEITILPLEFDDIIFPEAEVNIDCNVGTDPSDIESFTGDIMNGYPFVLDDHVEKVAVTDAGLCNIHCVYTDKILEACGEGCAGNVKIERTWICVDWCSGRLSESYTQMIKVIDLDGPAIEVNDTIAYTSPGNCKAGLFMPNPWKLNDNCDVSPKWWITGPVGVIITEVNHSKYDFRATGLSKGENRFLYYAEDCCGNVSVYPMTVFVKDNTPPVAVVKQNVTVSLTAAGLNEGGHAKLFAENIDNGSYDDCGPVKLEIRRENDAPKCGNEGVDGYNNNLTYKNDVPYLHVNDDINDTDGGRYVNLCCEDLTTALYDVNGDGLLDTGYIRVLLRVWDDADEDGHFGSEADNYNESWSYVRVEDKILPVIQCPGDTSIYCNEIIDKSFDFGVEFQSTDLAGFDKTGFPEVYTTCPQNIKMEFLDDFTAMPEGNNCGLGSLTRTFRATLLNSGNDYLSPVSVTCNQKIHIEYNNSFQPWVITPPPAHSAKTNSCDGPTPDQIRDNGPSWLAGPCDLIAENVSIDRYFFGQGTCKKWLVEYNYFNWCTNESRGPYFREFEYQDEVKPMFKTCMDTTYTVDLNCSSANLRFFNTAYDDGGCSEEDLLRWQVFVDLWADGIIDYEFTSFVAPGTDQVINVNGNNIRQIYVAPTANGAPIVGQGGQPGLWIPELLNSLNSTHKVQWKVTDECGNMEQCENTILVVDKKSPTPYCVSISTALMQGNPGMVELWARDFDLGAFDNCSSSSTLFFTFEGVAPLNNRIDEEHFYKKGPNNTSVIATVADYNRGRAYKWLPDKRSAGKVFTQAGTFSLNIDVWDESWNTDFCMVTVTIRGDANQVMGSVRTYENRPVRNVVVTADSHEPDFPVSTLTDAEGNYLLDLPGSVNFTVGASKDTDYNNGVTTLDVVLIQRHLMDMQTFTNPYQYVAADANNDSRITASDLVELRNVILGLTSEFTNQSWRFPVFGTPINMNNGITFIETVENSLVADFVAVKIGDVNQSASYDVFRPNIEPRTSSQVVLGIDNEQVPAGQTLRIPVYASQFESVTGFQYTMNLHGVVFEGIEPGAIHMTEDHVGVLTGGHLTMTYAASEAVTVSPDEVLFTLILKTDEAGSIMDMMTLTSDITKAESYDGLFRVGGVRLTERNAASGEIVLMQNEPNPFKTSTKVGFDMPMSAEVTITVTDVTGKVLATRELIAERGVNTVEFTREELGGSGVLFYTLTSGEFSSTKKMIVIE